MKFTEQEIITFREFYHKVLRTNGWKVATLLFNEMGFAHRKETFISKFPVEELESELERVIELHNNNKRNKP